MNRLKDRNIILTVAALLVIAVAFVLLFMLINSAFYFNGTEITVEKEYLIMSSVIKKDVIKWVCLALAAIVVICLFVFIGVYMTRFQTMSTIDKLTNNSDYNVYSMEIKYEYDLDRLIGYGMGDDQAMVDAIVKEALPLIPVKITPPDFGCSAFTLKNDETVYFGRNYDFRWNTSCMIVKTSPKNGYKSVALCALDNIEANEIKGLSNKFAALTAPFMCLDGMNENGVAIAVLTLDSDPTVQDSGKEKISTSMAIRLVLDRATTTQDAVDILRGYDMVSSCNRDYHFYITDASGDGRIIEYDCESEERTLVDTPVRAATNFFELYTDKVDPNKKKNGKYGHGKDRWITIEKVLSEAKELNEKTAWDALRAVAQLPNPNDPTDVTSNTQWSVVYDLNELSANLVLRRDWNNVVGFSLQGQDVYRSSLLKRLW